MTSILFSLSAKRFDPYRCSEIGTERLDLSLTQFRVYRLIKGVSSDLFCLPNKPGAEVPFSGNASGLTFTREN